MECWINDVRIDVYFFQHSNTPSLQYPKAETFKNCWQPLNYLIYSNIENLVLWARSQIIGFAVK